MADVTQRQVQSAGETNVNQENERAAPVHGTRGAAAYATRNRPQATWRLSPSWRKLLLSMHIIVSVGLLGTDAAVLMLCIAGARGSNPITIYPAAHLIAGTLLIALAVLGLTTGLALGLLTSWGVVRYWWVTIKFTLNVAGLVLGLLVLVPTLGAATDTATAVVGAPLPSADRLGLVRDASTASIVLVVTVLLAVYKPFGRLRGRRTEEQQ